MSETMNKNKNIEEVTIPLDLKTFLTDISDERFGYKLGSPWKFSEKTLGVVVPILREHAPDREYVTMYEVLKELNIKDTGHISQVELQNKSGKAIFIRAGTIFTGNTQNRAAQHSGVYNEEKETINVNCVHASHGIHTGEKMKFGDIAPPSVTINLMTGNQSSVWNSVRNFTGRQGRHGAMPVDTESSETVYVASGTVGRTRSKGYSKSTHHAFSAPRHCLTDTDSIGGGFIGASASSSPRSSGGTDNLLGHLQEIKEGQSVIDDMMQKVPLFDNQVGAIIFNPVGVTAVETFDHAKSWEAIKKEIIEKYGDKIKETQAEHLFELKPDMIVPAFRKFIEGLDKYTEKTIKKDNYSETREVHGEGVIGEYTLVKGQPIHVLLLKEEKNT